MKKASALLLSAIVLLGSLCSCSISGKSTGSFLALPKIALEYEQLQEAISDILLNGGEYAAPVSGYRRQAVQLEDLDRDGVDEALLFIRQSEEKQLKLCLFSMKDGQYRLQALVETEGSSFDSVFYADMNGDGYSEILTGVTLGSGLPKAMKVFSPEGNAFFPLLSETYSSYTMFDIDLDRSPELVLIKHDPATLSGSAEVYEYSEGDHALLLDATAAISTGAESVLWVKTGSLKGGRPAVFVSSQINKTDMLTDIFVYRGSEFSNISYDEALGTSAEIVRGYSISGTDINGDGLFDLPQVEPMPVYASMKSAEQFRKIVWRNYSLSGTPTEVIQTFHNRTDGWYLVLPKAWEQGLAVDRRDTAIGERTIVFSLLISERAEPVDLLFIYAITGDNKLERSRLPRRFMLKTGQEQNVRRDAIFAARLIELPPELAAYKITEEDIMESFRFIQTEWLPGGWVP